MRDELLLQFEFLLFEFLGEVRSIDSTPVSRRLRRMEHKRRRLLAEGRTIIQTLERKHALEGRFIVRVLRSGYKLRNGTTVPV